MAKKQSNKDKPARSRYRNELRWKTNSKLRQDRHLRRLIRFEENRPDSLLRREFKWAKRILDRIDLHGPHDKAERISLDLRKKASDILTLHLQNKQPVSVKLGVGE